MSCRRLLPILRILAPLLGTGCPSEPSPAPGSMPTDVGVQEAAPTPTATATVAEVDGNAALDGASSVSPEVAVAMQNGAAPIVLRPPGASPIARQVPIAPEAWARSQGLATSPRQDPCWGGGPAHHECECHARHLGGKAPVELLVCISREPIREAAGAALVANPDRLRVYAADRGMVRSVLEGTLRVRGEREGMAPNFPGGFVAEVGDDGVDLLIGDPVACAQGLSSADAVIRAASDQTRVSYADLRRVYAIVCQTCGRFHWAGGKLARTAP